MRVEKVVLHNYRGVAESQIGPLGPRVAVVGPNGSGKSTFASALLNGHRSGLADVDRPAALDFEVVGPDNWEWECVLDVCLSEGQDVWDAICDRRCREYLVAHKVGGSEGSVACLKAGHAWRKQLEERLYKLCKLNCGTSSYYDPVKKAFGDYPKPEEVTAKIRKIRVTISHTGANDPASSRLDFLDARDEVVIPREVLREVFLDDSSLGIYDEYVAAAFCYAWIGGILMDVGSADSWVDTSDEALRPDAKNLEKALHWAQAHDPDRLEFVYEKFHKVTGHTLRLRIDPGTKATHARLDRGAWQVFESLAAGHLQVITVLLARACALPDRVCVVDEPERALHPEIARRLSDILFSAEGGQVIVFTHSPVFVNPARASTVLRFAHVPERATIDVAAIDDARLFEVLDSLGARGSDIFLYNRILWVEGPSDEIYLRYWLRHFARSELREIGEVGVVGLPAGPWGAANLVPEVLKRLCGVHAILLDGDATGKAALKKATDVLEKAGAKMVTWKTGTLEQLLPPDVVAAALGVTTHEAAQALDSAKPFQALQALPKMSTLTKVELAGLVCTEERAPSFKASDDFMSELSRVFATAFPRNSLEQTTSAAITPKRGFRYWK